MGEKKGNYGCFYVCTLSDAFNKCLRCDSLTFFGVISARRPCFVVVVVVFANWRGLKLLRVTSSC